MAQPAAAASAEPRVVFLWYADGGAPPSVSVCPATPPAYACSFGGDKGIEGCKRAVQTFLDEWYADFNVVFTFVKPQSGAYYTVIVTSSVAVNWPSLAISRKT